MTPEETKWRASVYAPEKIRRKLKYWLLGAWSVLAGAWVVVLCTGRDTFGWMTAVVLLAGYANIPSASSTTGGSWPGKSRFRVGGDNKRKRRKNAKKYGNHKKRSYVIHLYTHHCRRDPFV